MLPLLAFLPVGTSLVLGVLYVGFGDARGSSKILVMIVFLVAVWLQFSSPYALVGMLLQIGLAVFLLLWRRLQGM